MKVNSFIDEEKIFTILNRTKRPERAKVLEILHKASFKKGISLEDAGSLLNTEDPVLINEMYKASARIKHEIYGTRLVLFAPIYISNYCINDCDYCGFHSQNKRVRKRLTKEEIESETLALLKMGHKRLLIECGEDQEKNSIDYVTKAIEIIYKTKYNGSNIRRVNVNIAATTQENYKRLKDAGIGTYQLFQETYHQKTYNALHNGPKADFTRQLFAHDRAFKAKIDDLGLGVLFGLYDYRFEVLGLLSHAEYLFKKFGVGPHTISVPRFQQGSTVTYKPSYQVSEDDLLKIIAILRLSVPYTGLIISTRERPSIRNKAFEIGISQTSACSVTSPGGYFSNSKFQIPNSKLESIEQFELHDKRKLDEIILSILKQGYLPSFCTACYRKGRTGETFMGLARPGDIQKFCLPNAILTFKEYLEDFTSDGIKKLGEIAIKKSLNEIKDPHLKHLTEEHLILIENNQRDLYL